jgi:hypothetical protein
MRRSSQEHLVLSAAPSRIGVQPVNEEGIIATSRFDERQRAGGTLPGEALLGMYGTRRVAASTLLRGAEGTPLTVIAVDTSPHIAVGSGDRFLQLKHRVPVAERGLVTAEAVTEVSAGR